MAGETRGSPERLYGHKTKIVCTLGPSTSDIETVRRMALAGMDVARLNSGHCDLDDIRRYRDLVVRAGEAAGKRIGIILDLQGPRVRVGSIQGSSTELKTGQQFVLTTEQKRGDSSRVSVSHGGLPGDLKPGDLVLIDDGLIRMRVARIDGAEVQCEVIEGGRLLQGKGMNFPGAGLSLPVLTERDRRHLKAGLEASVDWISQSFVRGPEDVEILKKEIADLGYSVPVMAKIEKREAVQRIDEIFKVADAVMVARGDLGVEMEAEEVPMVQKALIRKALREARPGVTATQMLESMVEKPRPTRAEASDVANAILDGTDALMLSAETAVGMYPVEAVMFIARIAARTEQTLDYQAMIEESSHWRHRTSADAIGYSACRIAEDMDARAVVTITRSGYTAKLIARYRPRQPVLAVSPSPEVLGTMKVVWGVSTVEVGLADDLVQAIRDASTACRDAGFVRAGDLIVVTGGLLDEEVGTTNMVHVHTVE